MKFTKRLLFAFLATLLAVSVILPVTPAYAIPEPDSTLQVSAVYVYEDLLEDDDLGILIDYYIDYGTIPDDVVTDAYLAAFIQTDGTTQLKSVAPYTFVNSGYGRGLVWIYFTASEVSTYGITQANEALHDIWLMGNPTLPWTEDTATGSMDGAIADDGGVQTDETAESNSAAANDMTLLPAVPAVGDAYYFGNDDRFDLLTINIGTQGDGTWEITWEYWDGSAWSELSGLTDGTTAFEAAVGNRDVSFDIPTDWNKTLVDTLTLYWVRARVSSYTAVVTQPLGTQSWVNPGDPLKQVAGIDYWQTSGVTSTVVALRVLYYADVLEIAWSLDMIEVTASGNKLTSTGESYFENVISSLRVIAPAAFATSEVSPTIEDLDYTTLFGATATGVIVGTPLTLAEGTTNVNTSGAGDIVFELERGTVGTVSGAVVTGSPLTLVAGTNTATVTGAGAITVIVNLEDTTTAFRDVITGTGFDLTDVATAFGMSRWFFSGVVWLIMSVLICAAVYHGVAEGRYGVGGGMGKIVIIVFDICIIGGALLGLLKPVVAVGMFLIFGMFIGYVLFFRGANV